MSGIDIDVGDSLVRTFRVRGRAIDGTTGQPIAASLQIMPRDPPAILLIPTGSADRQGRFDMWGALPGPVYLVASGGRLNGLVALDIAGADVDDLTLTLWPGTDIPGRIRLDGRGPGERHPPVNGLTDPSLAAAPPLVIAPPAAPGATPVATVQAAARCVGPRSQSAPRPSGDCFSFPLWTCSATSTSIHQASNGTEPLPTQPPMVRPKW